MYTMRTSGRLAALRSRIGEPGTRRGPGKLEEPVDHWITQKGEPFKVHDVSLE
jgi:hypothetical protein